MSNCFSLPNGLTLCTKQSVVWGAGFITRLDMKQSVSFYLLGHVTQWTQYPLSVFSQSVSVTEIFTYLGGQRKYPPCYSYLCCFLHVRMAVMESTNDVAYVFRWRTWGILIMVLSRLMALSIFPQNITDAEILIRAISPSFLSCAVKSFSLSPFC